MAKKSIESLYDTLFNMRVAMEDICQDAEGLLNDVSEFGGELNRVMKEQLSRYFIPGVSKLIKDEQTPGSIIGLIRFMDSLPLAMTRVEPSVDDVAPIVPENPAIDEPVVDSLPQNASFSNRPQKPQQRPIQQAQESLEKTSDRVQEKKADEEQPVCKYQVVRRSKPSVHLSADIADVEPQVVMEYDDRGTAEKQAERLNATVLPEERDLFGTEYAVEEACFEKSDPEGFDMKKAMDEAE